MFIFYRHHRYGYHRCQQMSVNCYHFRYYMKSENCCFHWNSCFLMMKNGCYYKKNGFQNFSMMNYFCKLLFLLHHFFFDKKKIPYCSPYYEYCSGEYKKNSYLDSGEYS